MSTPRLTEIMITNGKRVALALVTIVIAIGLGAAGISAYQAATASGDQPVATKAPTKGAVPPAAWRADGTVDFSLVPDFVSALARDGSIAGYVPRDIAISDAPQSGPAAVYGDDLVTVVGHMYPGRGFVPLGTDPEQVPEFPVSTPSSPEQPPN
jgi:hypothetical protein